MDSSNENEKPTGAFVTINDCRIWRVRGGEKEPAILFLHGLPTNSHIWRNIQGPLSRDYLTLAPDLPGLGRTGFAEGQSLRLQDQADLVTALLDREGIRQTVVVAHDVGGAVALFLTACHPERVRALVLMDVVAHADSWPVFSVRLLRLPLLGDLIKVMPEGILRFMIRRAFRRGLRYKERLTAEVFQSYVNGLLTPQGRLNLLKFIRSMEPAALEKTLPEIGRFRIPRLILWADNDSYLPLKSGQRLFDIFPSGKFVHIANAGHFLQEDQPERIVEEIRKFMVGLPVTKSY